MPLTFLMSKKGTMQKVIVMIEELDFKQWGVPLGT